MPVVSADVTNVEAELLKAAAGDPTQVAELQARVKELEMEQNLMQRELDNMSDVAQRTDNQLRFCSETFSEPTLYWCYLKRCHDLCLLIAAVYQQYMQDEQNPHFGSGCYGMFV